MLKKTLPGLLDWVLQSGALGPRLDPALMGRGLVGGWGETEGVRVRPQAWGMGDWAATSGNCLGEKQNFESVHCRSLIFSATEKI